MAATNRKEPARRLLRHGVGFVGVLALVGSCARAGEQGSPGSLVDGATFVPPDADLTSTGNEAGAVPPEFTYDSSPSAVDTGIDAETVLEASPYEGETSTDTATVPVVTVADGAGPAGAASSTPTAAGGPDAATSVVPGESHAPAPTCPQICASGCCNANGLCLQGTAVEACGTSGAACQNCSSTGQTCQSQACQTPPTPPPTATQPTPPPSATQPTPPPTATQPTPPPAPPSCDPAACTNLCVPYFVQCCKADATCGCALLFPRGSCN